MDAQQPIVLTISQVPELINFIALKIQKLAAEERQLDEKCNISNTSHKVMERGQVVQPIQKSS